MNKLNMTTRNQSSAFTSTQQHSLEPKVARTVQLQHPLQQRRWQLYGLIALTLLLTIVLASSDAIAAKDDFSQPIDVSADRSEYNETTGIQELSGNVEIRQGSMLIEAQRISVKLADNKLSVIEGTGNPIRFQQANEQGEMVTAICDSIIYEAAKGVLTLIGNASLKQPKQELKSDKIVFNSIDQSVVAEGGKSGRVNITIQPPSQTQ